MSFYNDMINKLTDVFKKTKDSNIGKLFFVISEQLDDLDFTLKRMDAWRDIDKAKGVHLDKLGSNIVQELRNGQSDAEYRMRIKTKIIANLSKGDIETINNVLTTFLGDKFVGVREMWSLDDPLIPQEPAGILITTETHRPFPKGVIGRVTAGGVSIYWHIILEPKNVVVKRDINQGKSEPFVYSGQLYSGPVYDTNTEGYVAFEGTTIKTEYAAGFYLNPNIPGYVGTITDSTTGYTYDATVNVLHTDTHGNAEIMYSGEYWSKGVSDKTLADVRSKGSEGKTKYRRSGESYAGEEG